MDLHAELVEQITREIRPHLAEEVTVTAETDLSADLDLDSIKVMEMMLEIEDRYDVAVPVNRLGGVRTVGDLATAIQQILQER